MLADVADEVAKWRRHVPAALYILALSALVLGCARPYATVLVPRERATVVMVMDTSGSMRAKDVRPSRLAAAKAAARIFMDQLPERLQVGLVTFSDEAQIQAQPTIDRAAVRDAIDSLRAEGATAMGDAIIEALKLNRPSRETRADAAESRQRAQRGSSTPRAARSRRGDTDRLDAVLLLSDGYNTSGEVAPMEAATLAKRLKIPVFTVALGTIDGVVQAPNAFGQMRVVQVPPDHDTLRAIAEKTDGKFFSAPSENDLRKIYEELGSRVGFVEDKEEVTYAFAAAGLVLASAGLVFSLLWGPRLP